MTTEAFANDYTSVLQGAITAGATSLVVASATGAPAVPFRVKVDDEIMLVTAKGGTTFTVTRGQEGTTGAAHADGATLEQILTAAWLNLVAPLVDKIGTGVSAPTLDKVLKGTGAGTSDWGNVGTLVGPLVFGPILTPPALSGATHNWNPANLATAFAVRMLPTASHDLTGIVSGVAGRMLLLFNASGFSVTLKHNNAGSSAANRFLIPGSGDLVMGTWESVWIMYDNVDGFWLVLGAS